MGMVKEFSIIKDGKVINRILCSDEFAVQYAKDNSAEVVESAEAVIGASFSGGKFVKIRAVEKAVSKSKSDLIAEMLFNKGIITAAELSSLSEVKK